MINKIKGAIFDFDGTLIDSLVLWDLLWERFGKEFLNGEKFNPDDKDDKAVRTMILKDAMHYLHSIYKIGESGDHLYKIADDLFREFYETKVEAKKGACEFLEECKRRGIKMCLSSATEKRLLDIILKRCNMEGYFDGIISCAEIGKGKDQPDIYLAAIDFLGTPKENTCVFEDSFVAITTAHNVGLLTVGVYDQYSHNQEGIKNIADVYIAKGETLNKLL